MIFWSFVDFDQSGFYNTHFLQISLYVLHRISFNFFKFLDDYIQKTVIFTIT